MLTRFLVGLLIAVITGLALGALVRRWEDPDDPEARRERARDRGGEEAENDDHQCHVCRRVSVVRELVELYDDCALCCASCAEPLRVQRWARGVK
ncbi:MAG: hypothetical protein ACK6DP_11025 [Gemmatimonas sp.]|uniref:hypothetical protein n=1 Tax=Gemmatimonas sp. TaxID=1962908 RepID=UPI00391F0A22